VFRLVVTSLEMLRNISFSIESRGIVSPDFLSTGPHS
jgi:hypothetical protein